MHLLKAFMVPFGIFAKLSTYQRVWRACGDKTRTSFNANKEVFVFGLKRTKQSARCVHSFIKSLQNIIHSSIKSRQTSSCQHVADPAWRVLRLCIYSTLQVKTVKYTEMWSESPSLLSSVVAHLNKKPRVCANIHWMWHKFHRYMTSMAPKYSKPWKVMEKKKNSHFIITMQVSNAVNFPFKKKPHHCSEFSPRFSTFLKLKTVFEHVASTYHCNH